MTNRGDSRSGRRSILPLVIGLPLIAIVAAVAIFFTSNGQEEQSAQNSGQSDPNEQATSTSNEGSEKSGGLGTPTLGEANAPVVMMEFSDYQ